MNILYYVPDITQVNGGVRQYACALLRILAQRSDNQYYIVHNAQDDAILSIIAIHPNLTLIPQSIGHERQVEKLIKFTRRLSNQVLEKTNYTKRFKTLDYVERLCDTYKIDIVCCPYQFVPETTRKTIVTLHDVQELHCPEFFSPAERLERAFVHKSITEKSSLIVVSYEHVKQDLITYFRRTETNVLVCLLEMQNLWFDKIAPNKLAGLEEYNLPQKFILYPAVTWPHKNHIGLLKAIALLRDKQNVKVSVVFTGHQTEYFAKIDEVIHELNLQSHVQFLGVVSEDVLYTLYRQAHAVVVPTLYEAGSFPLMESILMGIPVVCSNVTSLPDTIGQADYVFTPTITEDIADKVYKICFDESYRTRNVSNSRKQADRLRNTNALTILTSAMDELLRK